MGYSPWGHKELDTTSLSLSHTLSQSCEDYKPVVESKILGG